MKINVGKVQLNAINVPFYMHVAITFYKNHSNFAAAGNRNFFCRFFKIPQWMHKTTVNTFFGCIGVKNCTFVCPL